MHVTLSNMYNVLYVLSVSSRGFSLFCKIGHLQFQLLWGWCHLVSFLETLPVKNVTFLVLACHVLNATKFMFV
jgi:hypothetical protein